MKGYVIRSEPAGLAVEWREFAPQEVRRLVGDPAIVSRRLRHEHSLPPGATCTPLGHSHGILEIGHTARFFPRPAWAVQRFEDRAAVSFQFSLWKQSAAMLRQGTGAAVLPWAAFSTA